MDEVCSCLLSVHCSDGSDQHGWILVSCLYALRSGGAQDMEHDNEHFLAPNVV